MNENEPVSLTLTEGEWRVAVRALRWTPTAKIADWDSFWTIVECLQDQLDEKVAAVDRQCTAGAQVLLDANAREVLGLPDAKEKP